MKKNRRKMKVNEGKWKKMKGNERKRKKMIEKWRKMKKWKRRKNNKSKIKIKNEKMKKTCKNEINEKNEKKVKWKKKIWKKKWKNEKKRKNAKNMKKWKKCKNEKMKKWKKWWKMMKKERKMKKWIHTQNLRRFPKVRHCCCFFVRQNPWRFPWFCFGMCLFPKENQQPVLGVIVFPKKSDNVRWTSNKNTHFSEENGRKKSLRSADLTKINLLEYYNHSTTTTTRLSIPSVPSLFVFAPVEYGRKERRLWSWWRHEQQSIAAALATSLHSSRGQKTARAGRGVRDAVHGQVPEALLPQEPGTQHFTLDDDDSVPELGGSRSDRLYEVRPQERVQRRTVEQIVDNVPVVPLLHTSEPQMVDSVVDVLKILDHSLPGGKAGKATRCPGSLYAPCPSALLAPWAAGGGTVGGGAIPLTVTLADGKDDRGIRWRHVWSRSGGTYSWMDGTNHNHTKRARPDGFTAGPGRYTNTGQLYLPGGRRLCDHARQVPAVHAREVGGASDPVSRQIGGYSSWFAVGAAQCILCRGPWCSTGPLPGDGVDVPVVVQRQVPWLTLLARAWLDSGYIFCVYQGAFWRISHIFYVNVVLRSWSRFCVLLSIGQLEKCAQ